LSNSKETEVAKSIFVVVENDESSIVPIHLWIFIRKDEVIATQPGCHEILLLIPTKAGQVPK